MRHVIRAIGSIAAACVLAGAVSVGAHHGTTISYDRAQTWTVKAVVTDFKYVNPHVQVFFDAPDPAGKMTHWSGELLPNPAMLIRNGWSRRKSEAAMAPGTNVTITAAPSRAGGTTVLVLRIEGPKGEDLLSLGPLPPAPATPAK